MKKQFAALFAAITIILAGAAGFGGAFLANILSSDVPDYYADAPEPEQNDTKSNSDFGLNADLFTPPVRQESGDAGSSDVELLNKTDNTSQAQSLTIPELAAIASNSVVEVYTETISSGRHMGQFVTEGAGSGVIISADGYIVTNNHVIDGSSKITVRLSNGTNYDAVLIGRDIKTDLAVVKINAEGLQPAVYGNSDNLVVGELAVAIGNPLGHLGGTVTDGIISALSRNISIDGQMMTLLQTSAAVNPGNSGGGLFNRYGELVGIVNAKSSGTNIEGIGFAIPVNLVGSIAQALIENGYVPGRVDFGASLVNVLDPFTAMIYRVQTTGVYVTRADSDSPLQAGDRIISIQGENIQNADDVPGIIDDYAVGDILLVNVARNGKSIIVELCLKQAIE